MPRQPKAPVACSQDACLIMHSSTHSKCLALLLYFIMHDAASVQLEAQC